MADQVTISTFLELRDNMSAGLQRVASIMESTANKVLAASRKMEQIAARSAKTRQQAETQASNATQAAAAREFNTKSRYQRQLEAARWRDAQRTIIMAERQAAREIALARKVAEQKAKIQQAAILGIAAKMHTGAAGAGDASMSSMMTNAVAAGNLIADAIKKAAQLVYDSVKFMYQKAIELNVEYEKTQTDIASALFTTNLTPSMKVGKSAASELMQIMHDVSLKLPGQAQQYYYIFAQSLPAAISVGMHDMQKYSKFISEYSAFAIKRNVNEMRAATDMQMMLQGRARITTNMFQKLLPYIGMTNIEFNKLMKTDRSKGIELLIKAVSQAASGMSGVGRDALTIFGEMQTRLQDIARIGGAPIFEAAKESVIDINTWLEKNKDAVHGLANAIATTLGDALRGAAILAQELSGGLLDIFGDDKKKSTKRRTLADVKADYEKALKSPLSKMGKYGYFASPIGKTIHEGELDRLRKEFDKIKARNIEMAALRKEMGTRIPEADIDLTKNVAEIAKQITPFYKERKFDLPGRRESEVLSEYLESRGMEDLDIQKVFTEMVKAKTVVPLSLPNAEMALLDTPEGRATNYNDFRHSNFNIKQEFAEGFDPDRIAVAFASDLNRMGEMKIQGAYGVAAGVR